MSRRYATLYKAENQPDRIAAGIATWRATRVTRVTVSSAITAIPAVIFEGAKSRWLPWPGDHHPNRPRPASARSPQVRAGVGTARRPALMSGAGLFTFAIPRRCLTGAAALAPTA